MAYGARALGPRSFHRSQKTGKPSTRVQRSEKKPKGEGKQAAYVKDAEVGERHSAETSLNMSQDRGKRTLPRAKREKPLWRSVMISRQRKSLPLCQRCHDDIQFNRPKGKKQGS